MKKSKLIDITTIKFLIVGVINTLVGTGVMFVLYNFFSVSYWISSAANYVVGSIVSYFLNKYFTGSLLPLIRLSEVYYIAAECAEEPETRFGYLNEVRRHRFIPILDSRDPQIDLENEIYKEYAKDFLGEGQLFFYMKRKGMTSFTGVNGVEIRETGDPVYQVPVPDMEKEFGNII